MAEIKMTLSDKLVALDGAAVGVDAARQEALSYMRQAREVEAIARDRLDQRYKDALDALLVEQDAGRLGNRDILEAVVQMRKHTLGNEEFSVELLMTQFDALQPDEPFIGTERLAKGSRALIKSYFGGRLTDLPTVEGMKESGQAGATITLTYELFNPIDRTAVAMDDVHITYISLGHMAIGADGIQAYLNNQDYLGRRLADRSKECSRLQELVDFVQRMERTDSTWSWDLERLNHLIAMLTPPDRTVANKRGSQRRRGHTDWGSHEVQKIEQRNMRNARASI